MKGAEVAVPPVGPVDVSAMVLVNTGATQVKSFSYSRKVTVPAGVFTPPLTVA